jgi:hypothetical protein
VLLIYDKVSENVVAVISNNHTERKKMMKTIKIILILIELKV